MPVSISIDLDAKEVKKALKQIGPKAVRVVANQSVNKAASGARTDATQFLSPKMKTKQKGLPRKGMDVVKSQKDQLRAKLVIHDMNINLADVRGVSSPGKGRNHRVIWNGKVIEGAFRLKSVKTRHGGGATLENQIWLSGTKSTYKSTGNRKIYRAYAYPLLQSYTHYKTPEHLQKTVQARLDKEFNRNIERRLERLSL